MTGKKVLLESKEDEGKRGVLPSSSSSSSSSSSCTTVSMGRAHRY